MSKSGSFSAPDTLRLLAGLDAAKVNDRSWAKLRLGDVAWGLHVCCFSLLANDVDMCFFFHLISVLAVMGLMWFYDVLCGFVGFNMMFRWFNMMFIWFYIVFNIFVLYWLGFQITIAIPNDSPDM
jgi:hypothetical protein